MDGSSSALSPEITAKSRRNAEIIRRRKAGELPYQIAAAMGLTRNTVIGVCNRAGLSSRDNRLRGDGCVHSVLSSAAVRAIRAEYIAHKRGFGCMALGKRYGVSKRTIHDVISRTSWAHVA
jgi:DNA-binding CsgD family transcriptional regulator